MKVRIRTLRHSLLAGACAVPVAAGLVVAQAPGPQQNTVKSPLFGAPLEAPPKGPEATEDVGDIEKLPSLQPVQSRQTTKRPEEGLPSVKVKGRFIMSGREAIALLEVDGQLVQVQKGSQLRIANDMRVFVTEINSSEVHFQAGSEGRSFVLR